MDRKLFVSVNESGKEKLRNSGSKAEMQKVTAGAGLQELSLEMLEGVSGGSNPVPPESEQGGSAFVSPVWFMKDE